jgi:hypothetical protein
VLKISDLHVAYRQLNGSDAGCPIAAAGTAAESKSESKYDRHE